MNNFLKGIEYLATENDYCFDSVQFANKEHTEFYLIYSKNKITRPPSLSTTEHTLNRLTLKEFEPKKLGNGRNATQEFSAINDLENYAKPVKPTAQNLLKLIAELKNNGIDLMDILEDHDSLSIYQEKITIIIRNNEPYEETGLKNGFKFENGHFKELNQTTEFKQLLKLLIKVKHEKEKNNGKKTRIY